MPERPAMQNTQPPQLLVPVLVPVPNAAAAAVAMPDREARPEVEKHTHEYDYSSIVLYHCKHRCFTCTLPTLHYHLAALGLQCVTTYHHMLSAECG